MATKNNNIRPFKPVSPGSILKDELEARGLQPTDFAALLNLDLSTFNKLLSGNQEMNQEISETLERQLGIPATFWLSLQKSYEEDCQKQEGERSLPFLSRFTRNRVAL